MARQACVCHSRFFCIATKAQREISSSGAEFISCDHDDRSLIVVFMHAGVLYQRPQKEGIVNAGETEVLLLCCNQIEKLVQDCVRRRECCMLLEGDGN